MAHKFIAGYMQARSEASRAAWERRWDAAYFEGGSLGPKGQKYVEEKYGPIIGDEEPGDWDDWPDVADFVDEEEDTP